MQNWSEATLQSELTKFRNLAGQASQHGQIELLAEDILKFSPKTELKTEATAGFMALVHGNEILGLPILNQTVQNLISGNLKATSDLYFALGNVPAALADKRFLEKDLNRCFNENSAETLENRRALVLEKNFLDKIDYLLDIHQTVQKSDTAFYIFQYSSLNCFSHLSLINTSTPTILQFENIGDQKGLSSDEYVRLRRRFGTTLELAQIGFNQTYFDLGYNACEKLVTNLTKIQSFKNNHKPYTEKLNFEIFEISNRIVADEDNSILNNTLKNFSFVEKGQPIGHADTPKAQQKALNQSNELSEKSQPTRNYDKLTEEQLDSADSNKHTARTTILSPDTGLLLFPKLDQVVNKNQTLAFLCTELHLGRASKLETNTDASHF